MNDFACKNQVWVCAAKWAGNYVAVITSPVKTTEKAAVDDTKNRTTKGCAGFERPRALANANVINQFKNKIIMLTQSTLSKLFNELCDKKHVIVPFNIVEQFHKYCERAGVNVMGGAFFETTRVLYID